MIQMLQLKTIKGVIRRYNETYQTEIELTHDRFDYWDNVLSIEWKGQREALAYHEINKQFRCSVLNQDLTKRQIEEKLDLLRYKVGNPEKYEERRRWMNSWY